MSRSILLAASLFLAGCQPPHELPGSDGRITDPIVEGKVLYSATCAACHLENGAGLPGIHPPLDGNALINGPIDPVIAIMLWGLRGPVTVNGVPYNSVMPMWKDAMNDQQIAAVLTYTRQAWTNRADEIGPHEVARMRRERPLLNSFLTPEDLAEFQRH